MSEPISPVPLLSDVYVWVWGAGAKVHWVWVSFLAEVIGIVIKISWGEGKKGSSRIIAN